MGIDPARVLDFSVNTNPFGPSPKVLEAIRTVDVTRYPDPSATLLRRALTDALGVADNQVLPGNGAVELVWLTARAYLGPGDTALVVGPTFGEYAQASRAAGATVEYFESTAEDLFELNLASLDRTIDEVQARLIFICNPNNPTGTYLQPSALQPIIESHPRTLFVIDEAYIWSLSAQQSPLAPRSKSLAANVLTLRSMTKDCAIPGIRLGYAVGPEDIIESLRGQQPPWSVNALAQAAGVAALADSEYLKRSLAGIREAKTWLIEALISEWHVPFMSETNFILLDVFSGAVVQEALLKSGFYVRDCASFRLPECVRISVRTMPECQQLVPALHAVLAPWLS